MLSRFHLPYVSALLAFVLINFTSQTSLAGNGPNFVLYDHHTGDKGKTEAKIFNDVGQLQDGTNYTAQLMELEYHPTDKWVTAAYLESHSLNGDEWSFDGFRLSTRYRLFDYGTFLNPVLYAEYVNVKESALYILEIVGRTDDEVGGEEPEDKNKRENEIESKLILGEDICKGVRLAFNWINATDLKSGVWKFGYATGLNYVLFEKESKEKGHTFDVKEMFLGLEFYRGLGDSNKGLTLDGSVTEHYGGLNLKTEFSNGAMLMVGGAVGLTGVSRDGIFRASLGIEFD